MNHIDYEILIQKIDKSKSMSRRNVVCIAYHDEDEKLPFVIKKTNSQEYIFLEKLKDIIQVPKLYYHNEDTFCCEYIHGITLFDWLNSDDYTLNKFRNILFNIIKTLIKIQKTYKFFRHGDLYTVNIILLDMDPVFIDFEMSSFHDKTIHELYDLYCLFYFLRDKDEVLNDFIYHIFPPDKYFTQLKYMTSKKFFLSDIKHENLPTLKEVLAHPFFLDCNKYGKACESRSYCQQCQDQCSEERGRRRS